MNEIYELLKSLILSDAQPYNPLSVFVKLIFALICGGIIGFERGKHNQPAGLRTHIIISVGACLIMVLSLYMGEKYDGDPTRIAAQVVSGIGFLGGAAILRFKFSIKGVTTVATIWTTAGIGLTIGGGLFVPASFAVGIVIFSLIVLNAWEKRVVKTTSLQKITIQAKRNIEVTSEIFTILKSFKIHVHSFGLTEDITQDVLEIHSNIRIPTQIEIKSLFYDLYNIKGILKIHLE